MSLVYSPSRRTLCLGVGNVLRRDDGIGPAIVRAIENTMPPGVECAVEHGEAARLVEAWTGYDALILVDAVSMSGHAGVVVHIDPLHDELPFSPEDPSSHGLGVIEALRLSEALGTLPRRVDLVCISGCDFGYGEGLSEALQERFERLVGYVRRRVEQCHTAPAIRTHTRSAALVRDSVALEQARAPHYFTTRW